MAVTLIGPSANSAYIGQRLTDGSVTLALPDRGGTLVAGDIMFVFVWRWERSTHPVASFGGTEVITWPGGYGTWRRGPNVRQIVSYAVSPTITEWQEMWWKPYAGESNIPISITGTQNPSLAENNIEFYGYAFTGAAGDPQGFNGGVVVPPVAPPVQATILNWTSSIRTGSGGAVTGTIDYSVTEHSHNDANRPSGIDYLIGMYATEWTPGDTPTWPHASDAHKWTEAWLPWTPVIRNRARLQLGHVADRRRGLH